MLTLAQLRSSGRLQKTSENNPPLTEGERGDAVLRVQLALADLDYPMPRSTQQGRKLPDGIFGPETKAVVKQFQMREGLRPDGVVGRMTLGKQEEKLRICLADRARRIASDDPVVVRTQ